MLMKDQFQDTVARLGLDENASSLERDLAELVWMRCESAFLQKSPQKPVLLKKASRLKQKHLSLTDIQFLTAFFSDVLRHCEVTSQHLKNEIQKVWLLCDPEDEKTKENFEYLNYLRETQRKNKKSINKLADIQHKMKKLR